MKWDLDEDWVDDATEEQLQFLDNLPYTISIPSKNLRVCYFSLLLQYKITDFVNNLNFVK